MTVWAWIFLGTTVLFAGACVWLLLDLGKMTDEVDTERTKLARACAVIIALHNRLLDPKPRTPYSGEATIEVVREISKGSVQIEMRLVGTGGLTIGGLTVTPAPTFSNDDEEEIIA